MHVLAVGQPYQAGRREWPETAEYNYLANGHELRLFWRGPSAAEVRAVGAGKVDLGLYTERSPSGYPLVVLLYRVSDTAEGGRGQVTSWSDASYSWHLVPEDMRQVPAALEGEERAALTVTLVDAATGLVAAIRYASMSVALSRALHDAIGVQASLPPAAFDEARYNTEIHALYARHPRSSDFLIGAVGMSKLGD